MREIEQCLQSDDERMEEINWSIEMNRLTCQRHMLTQRDIFLKELVIEYATKDKLDEIAKLDNFGPDDWQKKLQDHELRMWMNQNRRYAHFTRMPNGPISRERKTDVYRRRKMLEGNPVRYLSQQYLLDGCKERGGCCARKCQCCMKPRGLNADGKLIHTHCTVFCGCCIRRRGFILRDPERGAGVPGAVDHAKETFCLEDLNGESNFT